MANDVNTFFGKETEGGWTSNLAGCLLGRAGHPGLILCIACTTRSVTSLWTLYKHIRFRQTLHSPQHLPTQYQVTAEDASPNFKRTPEADESLDPHSSAERLARWHHCISPRTSLHHTLHSDSHDVDHGPPPAGAAEPARLAASAGRHVAHTPIDLAAWHAAQKGGGRRDVHGPITLCAGYAEERSIERRLEGRVGRGFER